METVHGKKWCEEKKEYRKAFATSKVIATEQGHVVEEAFYDAEGNMIGYWACGSYDPAYPFQG